MLVPIICIAALLLSIAAVLVVGNLDQWDRALRRRRLGDLPEDAKARAGDVYQAAILHSAPVTQKGQR